MNILIIGSEGFIGSHLYSFFKTKHTVYTCDINASANPENHFLLNAAHPDFNSVFEQEQFQYCINASGSGNVGYSFVQTENDFTLNTANVFHLLTAIKTFNSTCKFINFSSAAVYGNPLSLPVSETAAVQPLSPYGYHKYYSELICKEFYHLFGIQSCNLRVFSAYGPGLQKQLFWDIYQKGIHTPTVELLGNGSETRDFIFIDDLCLAIQTIINSNCFHADVINVASGLEVKISTATTLLTQQLFENKQVVFTNQTNQGNPINWQADITKLKSLGFTPKTSIEEGLTHYANWIKNKFAI